MNLLVRTPLFRLVNEVQCKQDATYLYLVNMSGNGHAIEIDAYLSYSRPNAYGLVCDLTYVDNLTGTSYTAKYDILVKKGQKIIIPFIITKDMAHTMIDGVSIRKKVLDAECIEGYCTSFAMQTATYVSGLHANYKHFSKKQVLKGVHLNDIFLTYFKKRD